MSDPFDVLREASDAPAPDVDAIKGRARKILRRRQVGLGAAAAVILSIAAIGIVAIPSDEPPQLAQQERTETRSDATSSDVRPRSPAAAMEGTTGAVEEKRADDVAAPAAGSSTAGSAVRSSGGSGAPSALESTLTVKEGSVTQRGAEFTLKVCNPGAQAVSRDFGTSQRYDFEVHRSDEVVWKWSDARSFSQIVGSETWKSKECKTYTERWNGMTSAGAPASAGRYEAVGVLTTTKPQKTKPVSFCLDLC